MPIAETQWISTQFDWREPERVRRFLERHSDMVPLVESASFRLRGFFPDALLCLEVLDDPDALQERDYLVCFLVTRLDPDEAEQRYEAFRDTWLARGQAQC